MPPSAGSMAPSNSADLMFSWPTTAASGNVWRMPELSTSRFPSASIAAASAARAAMTSGSATEARGETTNRDRGAALARDANAREPRPETGERRAAGSGSFRVHASVSAGAANRREARVAGRRENGRERDDETIVVDARIDPVGRGPGGLDARTRGLSGCDAGETRARAPDERARPRAPPREGSIRSHPVSRCRSRSRERWTRGDDARGGRETHRRRTPRGATPRTTSQPRASFSLTVFAYVRA